jgi:hypothetical protein
MITGLVLLLRNIVAAMRLVPIMFLVACGSAQSQTSADEPPGPGDDLAGESGLPAAINAADARKLVFVTSQAFNGNLGGLAGADAKCQTLARAAGLPGTYKAWLGNATVSAASRLTHATVPYTLVNGTVIANDFADLGTGKPNKPDVHHFFLRHALDLTELGTPPVGGTATGCFNFPDNRIAVWTNAGTDGRIVNNNPVNSCGSNWNSAGPSTASGPFGVVGVVGEVSANWAEWCGGGQCEKTAPLYCFQQ